MRSALNTLRAYAELARISNLPTTLSNVMVGVAIGAAGNKQFVPEANLGLIALIWLSIACLYMAGMALNDLIDVRIDVHERPNRPIPSGRITRRAAGGFTVSLFVIGLAGLALCNRMAIMAGAVLVVVIIFYNAVHSRTAASVVLLGLARGLIYGVGAAAVTTGKWPHVDVLAGALALYTMGFSLIARREMQPYARGLNYVAESLPFIVIVPLFAIGAIDWLALVFPLAIALMWLSRGAGMYIASAPNARQAVMIWISGICLIDAVYLLALQQEMLALLAWVCFVWTTIAQRRIAGT